MKNTKKLLALFVAMAMLVTVCVPFGAVFAAAGDAEIQIWQNGSQLSNGAEVARNSDVEVRIVMDTSGMTALYGYTLETDLSDADSVELPAGVEASANMYVSTTSNSVRVGANATADLLGKVNANRGVLATFTTSVGRSRTFEVNLQAGSYTNTVTSGDPLDTVDVKNLTAAAASVKVASSGGGNISFDKPGGGSSGTSQSSAREITSFVFKGFNPVAEGEIDTRNYEIAVSVPPAADLTRLIPTIEISEGATISPASGVAQDFTEPVEYVVTAENGAERTYTVTVTPDGEGEIVEAPFEFVDLPEDHWAKPYIDDLVARGIISGDADLGTVRPDEAITRQEAAKIAVVGIAMAESTGALTFADADQVADWAKGFVAAAAENDIVTGYEDNTFRPNENITREQFAAVIMRAFEFGESTAALTFADADQMGWSKGYVAKAVELGIINGYADNTFLPANNVTRAEAFKMLSVALDVAESNGTATDDETTNDTTEEETAADEETTEDETTTDEETTDTTTEGEDAANAE